MLSVNISDVPIITIKNVDYCCIIHNISKSAAINLLESCMPENVSCKTLIGPKPLRIRFEKIDRFNRIYDGARYLP